MEGKQLQKPVFVKLNTLVDCRDGYNVYVKVVSVEESTNQNGNQTFVRALVADQTGAANAFFKGESTGLIQKDQVIAIRNGRVKLIKNHISLEIDIFGRITKENIDIKANVQDNISEKESNRPQRKPRREDGDRRPRRQGEERRPRREDGDRKPREEGDRRPRRQDGDRKPREEGDRRPRREDGDRKPREEGDRRPRREDGDRKPREEGDRRPKFEGDRKPREDRPKRDNDFKPRNNDFKPRRDNDEPRRRFDDDRPKMEWTKIGAIEPGDERLNITAKIISVEPLKNRARVVIGDETGVVKAFLYNDDVTKEGSTIVIFKAEASVVKQHIEVQLMKGGRIEESRTKKINEVDESVNISAKAWVESS